MKQAPMIARIILGLIFVVFGLNGFLNFLPLPPPAEQMGTFMGGLMASVYFFPLLKGTEVVCGLLLLANAYVPLALVILAPIVLNIFLVHVFMAPEGMPIAIVMGLLQVYLSFFVAPYSKTIKALFSK